MQKTPGKKGRGKASPLISGANAPGTSSPYRDTNADGSMNLSVLFQARAAGEDSTSCPPHMCLMSSGDMKKLNLFGGSCVALHAGGSSLHLRALPSPKTLPGTVVLNRIWSSNFSEQSGSRKVAVLGDFGRTKTIVAAEVILKVSPEHIDNARTNSFLLHVRGTLCGVSSGVALGNSISVLWRAKTLSVKVHSVNGKKDDEALVVDTFFPLRYVINPSTALTFESRDPQNELKFSMTSALMKEDEENVSKLPVEATIHPMLNSVPSLPHFGGYSGCVREAWHLMLRGLELEMRGVSCQEPNKFVDTALFKPPRGMLIYGPRGGGKSSLMRKLAEAANVSTEEISHSIILSRFVGEAEMELRMVFQRAARRAPCVVLIDDIDALCPQRGSDLMSASDVQQRLTSSLLSILDGADTLSRVFVIATSAAPSRIDSAMRRPGRLQKEFEIGVPTPVEREEILFNILKFMNIKVIEDDEIVDIDLECRVDCVSRACLQAAAVKAHGMVASDLVLVCKEALLESLVSKTAVSKEKIDTTSISIAGVDLLHAIDRVVPSAMREVAVDVPCVKWTDIGGMDDVKKSLREVVEWPLLYPHLFMSFNLPPPRGVLLYGPPGCSKTLMAKALATESGMNFLAVRGPELLSKWLGDSEKAVQTLFRRARAVAPSIIFFDEIDALATKRGVSSAGVNDRVLAQLLTELDGPQNSGTHRVVVVAATNRPDILDPALLRPGRVDRKIYVPPPDEESRRQIICGQLIKFPCATDIDIGELVALSSGFSGAEVVAMFQEAAMDAIEEMSKVVTNTHLLKTAKKTKPQITHEVLNFYNSFRIGSSA